MMIILLQHNLAATGILNFLWHTPPTTAGARKTGAPGLGLTWLVDDILFYFLPL